MIWLIIFAGSWIIGALIALFGIRTGRQAYVENVVFCAVAIGCLALAGFTFDVMVLRGGASRIVEALIYVQ